MGGKDKKCRMTGSLNLKKASCFLMWLDTADNISSVDAKIWCDEGQREILDKLRERRHIHPSLSGFGIR